MKLILSFTAFSYLLSLRKPVREEVRQILGGADEAGVSADGRLAFAVLKEMGAVQFESTAASNIAASNSVANNQCVKAEVAESSSAAASPQDPQVEPWLAAAQPDGPVNDAACVAAQVDAGEVAAQVDAGEVAADDAEPVAAYEVNAGVDEVAEVGRPSCMPRQATALPVDESVSMVGGCEPMAGVGVPVGGCEPNACEAEPEWAEPMAAVRCEGRPEVWLDMERLTVEQAQAHFPGTTWASLEQALPVEEFRRGSTLKGVEAALLKPTVLNVRPDKHIDAALRMDLLVLDIYQLIKSRRCLLFEQVRALLNSDYTNECYNAVSDAFARESDREEFLSMSRTERLHVVAQLWIINVLAMREDCKQQVA